MGTEIGIYAHGLFPGGKEIKYEGSSFDQKIKQIEEYIRQGAGTIYEAAFSGDNKIVAHKEEPLTLLLHWADYWTAHIYEEGRVVGNDNRYYQLQSCV